MGESDQGIADAVVSRSVRISSRSGRVDVIAEPRDGVAAYKGGRSVTVEDDGTLTVSSRSSTIVVRVPEGTDLAVGTISGRVTVLGRLGKVAVTTVSSRISVESAEQVDARTVSGRVSITECSGEARVDAVSGRAEIGAAGAVFLSTASGRISVDRVRGKVRARAVSGRIEITITESPVDVKVESVTGRIRLRAPAGAAPSQRLVSKRGSVTSALANGTDGEIWARTVSGAVRIDEAP
jgi:DUF4097 and DUF4098 domain-containing protein YvlB